MLKSLLLFGVLVTLNSITYAQRPLGARVEGRLSDHSKNDTTRVRLLNQLSHRPGLPPHQSKKFAREAITIAQNIGFKEGEADGYRWLARPFSKDKKLDSALIYYTKALNLFVELNNKRGKAYTEIGLSNIFVEQGRFPEALELLLDVLVSYQDLQFFEGLGKVYNQIGEMYLRQGEFDLAIFNLERSLESHGEYPKKPDMIRAYTNLAKAYESKGELKKAFAQIEYGIEIEERNKTLHAPLFLVKGRIHTKMREYKEAEKAFLIALNYSQRMGSVRGEIQSHQFLAENNFAQQKFIGAKSQAIQALNLNETLDNSSSRFKVDILYLLAQIEKEQSNFAAGIDYALNAKTLSDSLFRKENLKTIAELQTRFENEKKEQTIKLLEVEAAAARSKTTLAIITGFTLLIIVSRVFWVVNKKKATKRKLEFENVKKELENYGVLIAEKDSFMTNLIERLRGMSRTLQTMESRKEVSSLIDSLHQNVELTWDEEHLLNRIEQINGGFFNKLEHQIGTLSKNEKRVASLVQMELSNKEIGNILNINARSVAQARYRLKKKMDLDAEDDLSTFLKKLAT